MISERRFGVNSHTTAKLVGLQRSMCCGRGRKYIVGGYRSANALQFKFDNRLDRHGILNQHHDTRANQNLTGLGLVAQPDATLDTVPIAA